VLVASPPVQLSRINNDRGYRDTVGTNVRSRSIARRQSTRLHARDGLTVCPCCAQHVDGYNEFSRLYAYTMTEFDRVMYLDLDTIVMGDLTPLLDLDVSLVRAR
jgi:hypothetical protein